jgi:hypothetical protein
MCVQTDALRVGSLNNVPSQVGTTVVPEVPTARRWDVRRFWAFLIKFGRCQRRYAPKTHLDSRFQARYGTLFKECTRMALRKTLRLATGQATGRIRLQPYD